MIRIILALLFVILFLLVSLILIPIGYLIGVFSMSARNRYAQAMISWAFSVVGFIAGAKITVKNKDRVPKDEAVLYVSNHRGIFDIVLLYAQMFRPTAIVSKKEIKKVPILSWWMILMHCRFMDRDDMKQSLKVILECIEEAKNGISILIYPEGTRSKGESELDMHSFKEGSFKIATKAGVKIVPVAMHGTRELLERQFPRIKAGKVTISYGEAIDPKQLDKDQQKQLGEICRERVLEMLKAEQE